MIEGGNGFGFIDVKGLGYSASKTIPGIYNTVMTYIATNKMIFITNYLVRGVSSPSLSSTPTPGWAIYPTGQTTTITIYVLTDTIRTITITEADLVSG